MTVTLYLATSLDGYIADVDGSFGFLEAAGTDYDGFDAFLATVDALAMGRATFRDCAAMETWPYDGKTCYVLTSTPDAFDDPRGVFVDSAEALLARAAHDGVQHLAYWGGGLAVDALRRVREIDRFVWGLAPVVLGDGIPLWVKGTVPAAFRLATAETFGPLALLTYETTPTP